MLITQSPAFPGIACSRHQYCGCLHTVTNPLGSLYDSEFMTHLTRSVGSSWKWKVSIILVTCIRWWVCSYCDLNSNYCCLNVRGRGGMAGNLPPPGASQHRCGGGHYCSYTGLAKFLTLRGSTRWWCRSPQSAKGVDRLIMLMSV